MGFPETEYDMVVALKRPIPAEVGVSVPRTMTSTPLANVIEEFEAFDTHVSPWSVEYSMLPPLNLNVPAVLVVGWNVK